MANYTKMAKDAVKRRKTLVRDLARARRVVAECEDELEVLRQVISALKGIGAPAAGRGARRGRKGRKGGKWRPGKPGRPPDWWREKQKAKKARKGRGRRRGRKPGRKAASSGAAPAAAST